jgi:hypothetical protein
MQPAALHHGAAVHASRGHVGVGGGHVRHDGVALQASRNQLTQRLKAPGIQPLNLLRKKLVSKSRFQMGQLVPLQHVRRAAVRPRRQAVVVPPHCQGGALHVEAS